MAGDSGWFAGLFVATLAVAPGACADTGAPADPHVGELESRAFAADVAEGAHVRAKLTALRASQGRTPAGTFVAAEQNLRAARASILAGRAPEEVFDDQLQLVADNSERDIGYWFTEAPSLDDIRFPTRLVKAGRLSVAIMVVRPASQDGRAPCYILFAMAEPDQSD